MFSTAGSFGVFRAGTVLFPVADAPSDSVTGVGVLRAADFPRAFCTGSGALSRTDACPVPVGVGALFPFFGAFPVV